jgi:hypothetical protein
MTTPLRENQIQQVALFGRCRDVRRRSCGGGDDRQPVGADHCNVSDNYGLLLGLARRGAVDSLALVVALFLGL